MLIIIIIIQWDARYVQIHIQQTLDYNRTKTSVISTITITKVTHSYVQMGYTIISSSSIPLKRKEILVGSNIILSKRYIKRVQYLSDLINFNIQLKYKPYNV